MAVNFRKVSALHVIETADKLFMTSAERALVAGSAQVAMIGSTIQAWSAKLDAAALLTGDIVGTTDTQTLTNKTIDAASNTISNIDTTMLAAGVLSTDTTMSDASNTVISSSAAIKAYVDAAAGAVSGALVFKGAFDASTGSFPADANKGFYYKVTVAGTVDGIEFNIGDTVFAEVDAASTTTYASNWFLVDNTEAAIVWADITNITTTLEQIEFLNTVTSNVQDQLNSKVNLAQIDTDITLAADSDALISSQKAVKAYVDNSIASFQAIGSTKVSASIAVVSDTVTLAENALLVSGIYVDQEGTINAGFTHTAETAVITFDDTTLDGKNVFVTYTI